MIQNTSITEKLEKKTAGDNVLHEFIEKIIDVEIQGKNYKKIYESEVNKALLKRMEGVEK